MGKELIVRKESKRYPGLYTVKYHNRVFYDNLWTEELKECRGKVELADGTVVVNPFTKIFNRNENGTDINSGEICLASSKINGFMAAATYVCAVDEVVISTTGSLDSDFVAMAEQYITPDKKEIIKQNYKGMTLLFEICHPDDPHIVTELAGAYLIGARKVKETLPYFSTFGSEKTLDFIAKVLKVNRPYWFMNTFLDIVLENKTNKHEGLVIYGQDSGTVLKMKTPYYLAMKAIARIKDISKLKKEIIDEEFYPLIQYILEHKKEFLQLEEQKKLEFLRNYYYA